MSEMSHDTVESTGNISTRLREGAQTGRWNADNADYACGVSIAEAEHAADELDRLRAENEQKDAEIADLRLRLDRWNHGDNSIGAKYSANRLRPKSNPCASALRWWTTWRRLFAD